MKAIPFESNEFYSILKEQPTWPNMTLATLDNLFCKFHKIERKNLVKSNKKRMAAKKFWIRAVTEFK